MPVKNDREYRAMAEVRAMQEEEYHVSGYASTFEPYVLWEDGDGTKYYEQIDRKAFDEADMSDVIMQYDHNGRVFARTKNGTLKLSVDSHGLKVDADLSTTTASKQLWEEIRAGLINQMSFAFTVEEDAFERTTRTRKVMRIKKLYDVSAVSIPANPGTEISARNAFEGFIEAEKAERQRAEERAHKLRMLRMKMKLKGGI